MAVIVVCGGGLETTQCGQWCHRAARVCLGWAPPSHAAGARGGGRRLLVRRRLSDPTARTASGVFAPQDMPLEEGGRGAGTRGTRERGVEAATSAVGLDHDAVRRGTGWYRHLTLALALLVGLRAGAIAVEAGQQSRPSPPTERRLGAFNASRGLRPRDTSPRCAGCGGTGS